VCIGEDHGTDGGQWYSQERPYLFFYDEKTNTYVGELTCDDTDGDDGENLGKPTLLKMVDLSYTGQYVDYGDDGVTITKFKKGQTEDPFDNNALMELRVQRDGIGDFFYDPFKCYWNQECSNCGDEQYEDYEFDMEFELDTFCAKKIPLTEDVKSQMEEVLQKYLNQDAECVDVDDGVIGCADEVYVNVDIFEFENSNETCGTTNGTDDIRLLWEDDRDDNDPLGSRPGLIRGADVPFPAHVDGDHRLLQRRLRRSRGRAKGRGRCRRCRRRNSNSRKLREARVSFAPDSSGEGEPLRRSLQQDQLIAIDECPVDLAKLFREQNETLFENVTESDVYNFTYLDSLSPSSQPSSSPMPSVFPSVGPSARLSDVPSDLPSGVPSSEPSADPSSSPSVGPSVDPSAQPSSSPSDVPSSEPSSDPSSSPSAGPSLDPSAQPSLSPSDLPSSDPSSQPSSFPSTTPSSSPSLDPSSRPSLSPSVMPSSSPSSGPSTKPSVAPSDAPSDVPSSDPSSQPSLSTPPSTNPSRSPSNQPSSEPSSSSWPSTDPSSFPSSDPSVFASSSPSSQPSSVCDTCSNTEFCYCTSEEEVGCVCREPCEISECPANDCYRYECVNVEPVTSSDNYTCVEEKYLCDEKKAFCDDGVCVEPCKMLDCQKADCEKCKCDKPVTGHGSCWCEDKCDADEICLDKKCVAEPTVAPSLMPSPAATPAMTCEGECVCEPSGDCVCDGGRHSLWL